MTDPANNSTPTLAPEDEGYHKGLKNRQVQMIGIGGAIGTGLFMGAGGRLHNAGPGLFLVFAACGVFVFLMLRALGELVLHRPSSGSFVSYAREFLGEKAAYVAGWLYFLNWAFASIVDVTAISLYMHYWSAFQSIPQWTIALVALVIVLTVNMISVKLFGELEFWASLIKVLALVSFLIIGTIFLTGRFTVDGNPTGLAVISHNSGWFPTGLLSLVVVTSGVVFAYAAVELVGTAAGETENPEKVMPRAINSVLVRIAVFYIGSLVLLALLLPYNVYHEGESPFVTVFSRLDAGRGPGLMNHIIRQILGHADDIMNFVVLTAALSSLNAGLYSTGRILRSMSMNGSAPKVLSRMSSNGVPFAGILLTACFTTVGVFMNLVIPTKAFETALDVSALGIIGSWSTIVICQLQLYRWSKKGILQRGRFQMPGAPYTGYVTMVFLAVVLVMMCFENHWNIVALMILTPLLIVGWGLSRDRVLRIAQERVGYTGAYPVVAETPMMDSPPNLGGK